MKPLSGDLLVIYNMAVELAMKDLNSPTLQQIYNLHLISQKQSTPPLKRSVEQDVFLDLSHPSPSLTLQYFCGHEACHISYKTIEVSLAAICLDHIENSYEDPTRATSQYGYLSSAR